VLSALERVLVLALHDERPVERLRALVDAAGAALDDDDRRRLAAIDPDGLRVASLVVRKLRFERVLRGDAELRAEAERGPDAFAAAFRRYAASVPPTAEFPSEEARMFRRFRGEG